MVAAAVAYPANATSAAILTANRFSGLANNRPEQFDFPARRARSRAAECTKTYKEPEASAQQSWKSKCEGNKEVGTWKEPFAKTMRRWGSNVVDFFKFVFSGKTESHLDRDDGTDKSRKHASVKIEMDDLSHSHRTSGDGGSMKKVLCKLKGDDNHDHDTVLARIGIFHHDQQHGKKGAAVDGRVGTSFAKEDLSIPVGLFSGRAPAEVELQTAARE